MSQIEQISEPFGHSFSCTGCYIAVVEGLIELVKYHVGFVFDESINYRFLIVQILFLRIRPAIKLIEYCGLTLRKFPKSTQGAKVSIFPLVRCRRQSINQYRKGRFLSKTRERRSEVGRICRLKR